MATVNPIIPLPGSLFTFGFTRWGQGLLDIDLLIIPDGPTEIPDDTFRGSTSGSGFFFSDVRGVRIPDSVTSIGTHAFSGWSSALELTIPDSVTSIGAYAFSGWSSALELTIPDSVTSIGTHAFQNWSSATTVEVGENVPSFPTRSFENLTNVETFTIHRETPPSLTANAFTGLNLDAQFYVPADSVDDYKSASQWSNFADRIYPIED